MEKKKYIRPAMVQMEVELQPLLEPTGGGKTPELKGEIEGDSGGLEYGGETKPGQSYNPW